MKKQLGKAAAVLAGMALALTAGSAMARTNVDISIGIPGVIYAQPAPVYVQPQPVYVQPRVVYMQPQPVYVERHRHRHGWHERAGYRRHDRDGDGVPNRWDARPRNPYRY